MRNGFIFDLNKCVGCHACVVACQIENEHEQTQPWREINTFNSFQHPNIPVFHFSMACNHCEDAPCMENCPALAYTKGGILNSINHLVENCIGCKYCTWACPYDAPKYINSKGIIEKCTLCTSRLEQELKPACANLCPTGALEYDDINPEPQFKIPGFTEKGINPGIKIIPLRSKKPPLKSKELTTEEHKLYKKLQLKSYSKISLQQEWVLVIFTLLAAILTSLISESIVTEELFNPWGFLFAGLAGMILSALHLGKKRKAWRSILNIKSSWLSREIISYTAFIGISFIWLFSSNIVFGYMAGLLGFITCYSIDKVYRVTDKTTKFEMHSASVLLTALLITSYLVNNMLFMYTILVIKLLLYTYRKIYFFNHNKSITPFISAIRMLFGFAIPLVFLILNLEFYIYTIPLVLFIAELIDRIEFYLELEVSTPKIQINMDLASMLKSLSN